MSELQQIEKKDESKPWKGICSKRCWFARKDKCRCRCKKQNHGKGVIKHLTDMEGKKDEAAISKLQRRSS